MSGRWLACWTCAALLALGSAAPANAQELAPGTSPLGITIQFEDAPYEIGGSTALDILDQLRALGPVSFTQYEWFYTYRWNTERTQQTRGGPVTSQCRPTDVEFEFQMAATYPRWIPAEGASERLVEAWDAFSERMEAQWDQYRNDMVDRARDAKRRAERHQDQCTFINDRVRDMIPEIMDEPSRRFQEEETIRLRWPPAGFEDLTRGPRPNPNSISPGGSLARPGASQESRPGTSQGPPPGVLPPDGPPAEAVDPYAGPPLSAIRERPTVRASVRPAVDVESAVYADTAVGHATAVVFDLHHLDQLQFREAFGETAPRSDEPLTADTPFEFPAMTEVLIAALAQGVAAQGAIDLKAPISELMDGLSPRMSEITMAQLLTHRSGLDNAEAPAGKDWDEVVADLDDRALFTDPGSVYSYSRYSFPLAAAALEASFEMSVEHAIDQAVLQPLGLTDTGFTTRDALAARDGLPVTRTTVADVTAFWTSWLAGDLTSSGPDRVTALPPAIPDMDGRVFLNGYWQDRIADAPRISLLCGSPPRGYAAGFQVFADTRTIFSFWGWYELIGEAAAAAPPSSARWPENTVQFVLSRIAPAIGASNEVYQPIELFGGSESAQSPRRCAEPALSSTFVQGFGPRVQTGDWAGRYINGEWFFELADQDGWLVRPVEGASEPDVIRYYGNNIFFVAHGPDEPARGFPIRLFEDEQGRKYVMLNDRAYLKEGEPGGPG